MDKGMVRVLHRLAHEQIRVNQLHYIGRSTVTP